MTERPDVDAEGLARLREAVSNEEPNWRAVPQTEDDGITLSSLLRVETDTDDGDMVCQGCSPEEAAYIVGLHNASGALLSRLAALEAVAQIADEYFNPRRSRTIKETCDLMAKASMALAALEKEQP